MKSEDVKDSVVQSYSELAKATKGNLLSKLFSCCEPTKNSKAVASAIGYSEEQIHEVPENSNIGVGCGNPFAITKVEKGDTVIDLGSGAGFDAFIVAKQVGLGGKVIGVDLSDDMLVLANKNIQKGNYQNVKFKKGDIEALPIEDNIADLVISNCVINLSLNKDKVFKEAYRVLKPGATLAISDIILEKELPGFVKNSLARHAACIGGAEKLDAYLGYVEAAGFKNIEVVSKKEFPLALLMADPTIRMIAQQFNFDINSEEAKDLASRVKSISLVAKS
jgi:SAM-dependent methyltransferase